MKALLLITLALFAVLSSAEFTDSPSDQKHAVFLNETYATGFIPLENDGDLFYMLLDSRNDPSTDPLVLWLNGGPGCSSVAAIFTENGPFKINTETLDLSINPYSWNNNANLLYVDQPGGTGFSSAKKYDTNEKEVATNFRTFMYGFLERHPQFNGRPFYITGESYAGHYIPVIAEYLIEANNPNINVRGIAIGNGWVDPMSQYPEFRNFAFANNLIAEELYHSLEEDFQTCNDCLADGELLEANKLCGLAKGQITGYPLRFNVYNIDLPCDGPSCYDFTYVDRFLALPEVIKALGVEGRNWVQCRSDILSGFKIDHEISYSPNVARILGRNIPALVYSGELDYVCNHMGSHAWTNNLAFHGQEEFAGKDLTSWGTWGEYKTAQGLTFVKIHNAGHFVPMDQPEAALHLLSALINGGF